MPEELKIATQSVGSVKLKEGRKGGETYTAVTDAIKKMKPSQEVVIDVPKGTTSRQMHNRLNGALKRAAITAPDGHYLSRRTSADDKKIVFLWQKGEAPKRPNRKPKPAAQ